MRPRELLAMPVESVSDDVEYLAPTVHLIARAPLSPSYGRPPSLSPSPRVSIAWLRRHEFAGPRPTRRVWVCGLLRLDGRPVAVAQAAGREGNDEAHLLAFDRDGTVDALRELTGRWVIRLGDRTDLTRYEHVVAVVRPEHDDPRVGTFWSRCLHCAWGPTVDLDAFDDPEKTAACYAIGCRSRRSRGLR